MAARRDRGDKRTEQQRKLFIGGIHHESTEESLQAFYEKWGEIVDCVVMREPTTGRSRGFGFVMYRNTESVDDALNSRPHILDGKEIDPKRAVAREESGPAGAARVKKVFVGGISPDTTEEHMQEYFSRYGSVESIQVITDRETGKPRGFGFVTYYDYDPVDKICAIRTHEVNGQQCEVKKAQSKTDDGFSRSGGGGRGGRGGRGGGARMQGGSYGGMGGSYGGGGYGGGSYGPSSGGYGAYGAYGAAGWAQADSGYASVYGSNLGSGYADGYGGGAMKGSAYAAKAPGPYGGGYGSTSAYAPTAYGGVSAYGGGYGAPAAGGYGGGASAYGGGAYGAYGSAGY